MADVIYTTASGVEILTYTGKKPQSEYDFIVKYQEPGKRVRTPKHIHLIIDLYMKLSGDKSLTMKLVDHIIDIIKKISPTKSYPPELQFFIPNSVAQFEELNQYGEYSVEFLLVVTELIMIQEKTNYPTGTMNLNLFKKFRNMEDIFSVVSAATFR